MAIANWRIAVMTTDELKARIKRFALRVMTLVEALPKTARGWVIANQIMRSTTSVGANYRAACGARSRAEFISKIGVAEEEGDETAFWLELIIESKIRRVKQIVPLLDEANELAAIIAASRKSAIANRRLAIR
jgi:four helix bundle protein